MSSNFYLSISDLLLVDGFAEAYANNDKETINKILFTNGIDITKKIEERECTHRNLRNDVVTCIRYDGNERTDKQWLRSGHASVEAHIDSTDDESLKRILRQSNREGYNWEDLCERLKQQEEGKE